MLKCFLVRVFNNMHVECTAEHHVLVHSFGSNFCDFLFLKLQERIPFRSCCVFGTSDAQFLDFTKLREKLFEFFFVETFGQVTDIYYASLACLSYF